MAVISTTQTVGHLEAAALLHRRSLGLELTEDQRKQLAGYEHQRELARAARGHRKPS